MEEIFNKIIEQLQYEREYSHADFPDYVENVSPCLDPEYDDSFSRGLERAVRVIRDNISLQNNPSTDKNNPSSVFTLPCKVGTKVYAICTCEAVEDVLDGSLFGSNGGYGTATGYYCPYELNDKCPHTDIEDCDECKKREAVFEDYVEYINIMEYEIIMGLKYTNLCITPEEIGKTVFFNKDEAEQKFNEIKDKI